MPVQQITNGEEFYYDFIIDELLEFDLNIQGDRNISLYLCKSPYFSVDINTSIDYSLNIKQSIDFILTIDDENIWSLQ